MQKIAAFIVKKRRLLLVVMLALAVVCAALMPFVGVNTDMTKYLPDSSQMKIGMDRMNEAFPDVAETYTIRVMFRGLDARDKLAIRDLPDADKCKVSIVRSGTILSGVVEGCIGCRKCVKECPEKALSIEPEGVSAYRARIESDRCAGTACRRCERVCPKKVLHTDRLSLT